MATVCDACCNGIVKVFFASLLWWLVRWVHGCVVAVEMVLWCVTEDEQVLWCVVSRERVVYLG